ncbi:hypothetical protein GCM10009734_50040 [Nonomuraea bangladeshensis]
MFGQVETPVQQRPPGRGGVGQEHADLAVLDPARGAAVLPLYPGRGGAFLDEAGLIGDQDAAGAEPVDDEGSHVIAYGVGIPASGAQQPLQLLGAGESGVFGQVPAVLEVEAGQQSTHVRIRRATWFDAAEPAGDPGHQLVEDDHPAIRVYAVARGHRTIFGCLHKLRMITRWPSPCDPNAARSPSVTGVLGEARYATIVLDGPAGWARRHNDGSMLEWFYGRAEFWLVNESGLLPLPTEKD